jgi:hypothetical protein
MKNLFKKIMTIILLLVSLSCNVEKRIKEYSYTNYWYYENNQRYQVYKTKYGKYYIIIVNKKQNKLIRKYIKHGR